MREFTVRCHLEELTETGPFDIPAAASVSECERPLCHVPAGAGSSKKAAKKAASEKMMAKLQSLPGSTEIAWVRTPPNPRPVRDAVFDLPV